MLRRVFRLFVTTSINFVAAQTRKEVNIFLWKRRVVIKQPNQTKPIKQFLSNITYRVLHTSCSTNQPFCMGHQKPAQTKRNLVVLSTYPKPSYNWSVPNESWASRWDNSTARKTVTPTSELTNITDAINAKKLLQVLCIHVSRMSKDYATVWDIRNRKAILDERFTQQEFSELQYVHMICELKRIQM